MNIYTLVIISCFSALYGAEPLIPNLSSLDKDIIYEKILMRKVPIDRIQKAIKAICLNRSNLSPEGLYFMLHKQNPRCPAYLWLANLINPFPSNEQEKATNSMLTLFAHANVIHSISCKQAMPYSSSVQECLEVSTNLLKTLFVEHHKFLQEQSTSTLEMDAFSLYFALFSQNPICVYYTHDIDHAHILFTQYVLDSPKRHQILHQASENSEKYLLKKMHDSQLCSLMFVNLCAQILLLHQTPTPCLYNPQNTPHFILEALSHILEDYQHSTTLWEKVQYFPLTNLLLTVMHRLSAATYPNVVPLTRSESDSPNGPWTSAQQAFLQHLVSTLTQKHHINIEDLSKLQSDQEVYEALMPALQNTPSSEIPFSLRTKPTFSPYPHDFAFNIVNLHSFFQKNFFPTLSPILAYHPKIFSSICATLLEESSLHRRHTLADLANDVMWIQRLLGANMEYSHNTYIGWMSIVLPQCTQALSITQSTFNLFCYIRTLIVARSYFSEQNLCQFFQTICEVDSKLSLLESIEEVDVTTFIQIKSIIRSFTNHKSPPALMPFPNPTKCFTDAPEVSPKFTDSTLQEKIKQTCLNLVQLLEETICVQTPQQTSNAHLYHPPPT